MNGAVMREPMNQTGIDAEVAGTGLQPRFEEQDRASQISARLIRNGQSHHAMRVEFPARLAATTQLEECIIPLVLGGCQVHRRRCYTSSLIEELRERTRCLHSTWPRPTCWGFGSLFLTTAMRIIPACSDGCW